MSLRWSLFIALVGLHIAGLIAAPDALRPAFAGSVYIPLMALDAAGMPVFSASESAGWSAPSWVGWIMVGILWVAVWWVGAFAVSLALQRFKQDA